MLFWGSFSILIFALALQLLRWFFLFHEERLGVFLGAKPALLGFLKSIAYGNKLVAPGLLLGAVLFIIGYYGYLTYGQYLLWRSGPPTIFFLPPYRGIGYLFGYHLTRFLLYYIVSLIIGVGLILLAHYGNKKFGEKFFDAEEPYLGALAIFLLGNRAWLSGFAWIFYFLGLAGLYLLVHIFLLAKGGIRKKRKAVGDFSSGNEGARILKKEAARVPLYWFWLTSAIVVMITVAR